MYECMNVSVCAYAVKEPQVLPMTKPGEVKALPAVERKMPWVLPPGGKLTAETSVPCGYSNCLKVGTMPECRMP